MEENKSYPYLGRRVFDGKQIVIFFLRKNYGVVVTSDDTVQGLSFGTIGDFDETYYEYLDKDLCVRLSN